MSENDQTKEKQDRQFDEEQYQRLKRCSEKRDIADWNEWYKKNEGTLILLEGADLNRFCLEGANLLLANLKGAKLRRTNLKGANLLSANFEGAKLDYAELQGASFAGNNFNGAKLRGTNLKGAFLNEAKFESADLSWAELEDASLIRANFKGANLMQANLEGATLISAKLGGANIYQTYIQNSNFMAVAVDGETLIWGCTDDAKTDFTGVALDSARVEPILKEKLKGNVRRMQWRRWCDKQGWVMKKMGLIFWDISDYGRSTRQIAKWFWAWALIFAFIYLAWGLISPPGIIKDLMDINPELSALRSIYFSVVTMTTLGFGDMHGDIVKCCVRH